MADQESVFEPRFKAHPHSYNELVRTIMDGNKPDLIVVRCKCGKAIALRRHAQQVWTEIDETDWQITDPALNPEWAESDEE